MEDVADDADLIVRALQQAGHNLEWTLVEDEAAYLAAIERPLDIILSDYSLPQFSAPRALELLHDRQMDLPLIVITGTITEEAAVECIKRGASDYLMKDRLGRLAVAVTRAIEQRRLRQAERLAIEAMAASQRRLQAIFENALDAIFVADDDARYVDVNPAACELTGYSRSELLAMSVRDLMPSGNAAVTTTAWQDFLRTGSASGEYQILRRDGSIVDVEYRAAAHALPQMHVSACRDISVRKQVEQARSQLVAIAEASDDAIIGKDLDGIVTAWNQGAQRMYGYTAEEIVGRSIALLFPEGRESELEEILIRLRRGESIDDYSTVRIAKDGHQIEVSAHISPIIDRFGAVIGAAVIARDVTDLHRRQREAARSEKLRALGQLASGVAHDLNQSLTLILGYSELLECALDSRTPDDTSLSSMVGTIAQAAHDGGETVKRLLTFARGEPEARREAIDIATMLEEVARLTAPRWRDSSQIENRVIRLTVETEADLHVLGTPHLLREALTNLIFNAIDALPYGGTIALTGVRDGTDVVIRVTDSGIGMSREVQSRVFEPFYTTKGERGSGLGLSLVHGIVESQGGTIRVDSAPGRGTVMTLRFPQADDRAATDGGADLQPERSGSMRILAIDDEVAVAALTARMLKQLGHEVTTEHSAEAGLRLLAVNQYDAIVSDVGLGEGMNGWEFVAQIRRQHPRLPVVLATGWGAAIGADETAQIGSCAVVPKPFRLDDLRRALAQLGVGE